MSARKLFPGKEQGAAKSRSSPVSRKQQSTVTWAAAKSLRSLRNPATFRDLPDFGTGAITSSEIKKHAWSGEGCRAPGQEGHRAWSSPLKFRVDPQAQVNIATATQHRTAPKDGAFTFRVESPSSTWGPAHRAGPQSGRTTSFAHQATSVQRGQRMTQPAQGSPAAHDLQAQRRARRRLRTAPSVVCRPRTQSNRRSSSLLPVSSLFASPEKERRNSPHATPPRVVDETLDMVVTGVVPSSIVMGSGAEAGFQADALLPSPVRPSSAVPPPSALSKHRKFAVDTFASVACASLITREFEETNLGHAPSVQDQPTAVHGSYSDLVPPRSALAKPVKQAPQRTKLQELSRPARKGRSESWRSLVLRGRKSKQVSRGTAAAGATQQSQGVISDHSAFSPGSSFDCSPRVRRGSDFWRELDRFHASDTAGRGQNCPAHTTPAPTEPQLEDSSQQRTRELPSPHDLQVLVLQGSLSSSSRLGRGPRGTQACSPLPAWAPRWRPGGSFKPALGPPLQVEKHGALEGSGCSTPWTPQQSPHLDLCGWQSTSESEADI